MVPELPQDDSFRHDFNSEIAPSAQQLNMLERQDVLDAVKQFILRQFIKRQVAENERQQILTDVTIVDMQTDRTIYGHNEHTEHFAASINKLPITMLVLEELRAGTTTLDTVLTWTETDRRAGNGVLDQPGSPVQATVRDVLHDLLNRSGNTAARALVNGILGGATATNNRLALVPELAHTRLIPLDGNRFYMGNTTSKEALFVLTKVLETQDEYGKYVRDLMATNIFEQDGVRSQLSGNDFIVLVNKTGLLYDPDGNNTHDVGIIYNTKTQKAYGYSLLTTAPSASETATVRADESLKNIGRYLLRYAGDKQGSSFTIQTPFFGKRSFAPEHKILY